MFDVKIGERNECICIRKKLLLRNERGWLSVELSLEVSKAPENDGKDFIQKGSPTTVAEVRGLKTSSFLRNEIKVVVCPAFAESITEGDIRWEKAQGDEFPVLLPSQGIIESLLVEDGATVSPGTELLKIKVGAGAGAPTPSKSRASNSCSTRSSSPAPPMDKIPVAAIRHAKSIQPPLTHASEIAGTRSEHRVKINRMRLKIAQRLKEAQNTNAMLTTFNELDMSALMQLREREPGCLY
ncbi:DLST [Lepeophtheirus salmonis]|uniref:Dihydrolipoyllysine-residue succinyltransferase component of 2-oxoglutarate dehydrogenase complex, mitochondrial n=1 Tax=Lepeophtheirus salmonis TaxID=72036 RepID=A0A7R8D129_LEPSM|nr:DLST [Lepeophtheirus salmonis]CAF2991886.1 DLST [Lepeophtheirus salmonis]